MLADLNSRWTRPRWAGWFSLLVTVVSSLYFIAYLQMKDALNQPPEIGGDSLDYDLIAWGLATQHEFVRVPASAEFLAPYQRAGKAPPTADSPCPVTDRPPAYPLVLAATFQAGRQFYVIRICQAIAMGLVLGVVSRILYVHAGLIPALLGVAIFLVIDPRPRTMVREILTECFACGLVTLLCVMMRRWDRQRRVFDAIWVGVVLGLLVLCRTMMVMWLPFVLCGMWLVRERGNRKKTFQQAVVATAVSIAVCAPWWFRNVRVLGEFRPLGVQGAEQLSAAYSDGAFARLGMWYNLDQEGFFDGIDSSDPIRRSLERVARSELAARQWVRQHPVKAAILWPSRVFQEIRPHGPTDLFILVFAVFGLMVVWKTDHCRIVCWLLMAQVFAIAATWSVAGRFVFPLLGELHLLAAIGLWGTYVALVEKREITSPWFLRLVDDNQTPMTT